MKRIFTLKNMAIVIEKLLIGNGFKNRYTKIAENSRRDIPWKKTEN
jgi:hypothetical protein